MAAEGGSTAGRSASIRTPVEVEETQTAVVAPLLGAALWTGWGYYPTVVVGPSYAASLEGDAKMASATVTKTQTRGSVAVKR